MASVCCDPNGRKRVVFQGLDGKRRSLRLGEMSKRDADGVARHVEHILVSGWGNPLPRDTAQWLADIPEPMYAKLVAVGLADARESAESVATDLLLGPFLDALLNRRTDIKLSTRINYLASMKSLKEFFGDAKPLTAVTSGDADDFRRWLLKDKKFSPATAGRQCGRAREFFRDAMRRKLVTENPFQEVDRSLKSDPARQQYISRDIIQRVIDAAPSVEWKLLIALSRFLGLRVPSEPASLKWTDVDWERSRLRVPSPKTEHHHGKDHRWVPILPEVMPYLNDVFALAPDGAEYILQRLVDRYPSRKDGWQSMNLRTSFEKIIAKAGCSPWPKLWHNLRASAQTDLASRFPLHVACAWLGNSQAVAAKHYLQVTDDHFAAATASTSPATVSEAARNPARTVPDRGRINVTADARKKKTPCSKLLGNKGMPPVGLEATPPTETISIKLTIPKQNMLGFHCCQSVKP